MSTPLGAALPGATHAQPAVAAPHALGAATVLGALDVQRDRGLSAAAVLARRSHYGANELERAPTSPAWRRFARHLGEPVVVLLLAAAAVSLALGESFDAAAIVAIVLVNAGIAFVQEERAERALESLRGLARPAARVLRNGALEELPAAELVPGDIVHLTAGDFVPADVRLFEAAAFRTQEAALTGESTPVDKFPDAVLDAATPLAERSNLAFAGTEAAHGQARGVVVAIGMATELGRIAGLLRVIPARQTPLQQRLGRLGRNLSVLCVAIALGLAVLYLVEGERLGDVLVRSIGLAVAAVPEGLPAVVAISLALGMRRLAQANALMRRIRSVETLGSVGVICTDKTGTLTRNEMEVREVRTASASFVATWHGTPPRVAFGSGGDPLDPDLARTLDIGRACNNAQLRPTGDPRTPWRVLGDPTEGALLLAAMGAGRPDADGRERIAFEVPFDSERKRMSVAVQRGDALAVFAKGAAEAILPCCTHVLRRGRTEPLDAATKEHILADVGAMGARGLRVLALACRDGPATPDDAECRLTFAGLVGMRDPPRDEVPMAVAACRAAGIRPVMITGDHPATALAIAREIGLASPDDRAVSGAELDRWSDAELGAQIADIAVFARTTAEHKLRLVVALQAAGHVVAMTGDGVNDAPALREADIGVAMGRSGTDVTREAADLVLLDDNFATIVAAVREGRGVFDNIQKVVHYLVATNASEVQLVVLAAVVSWPPPLTALQLLWINLVTDALPALALGMEPVAADVLQRPPRRRDAPVVTRSGAATIAWRGLLATAAGAFAFSLGDDTLHARTLALATLVNCQLGFVFAFRSHRLTLPQLGVRSNPILLACVALAAALQAGILLVPGLRTAFGLSSLTPADWAATVVIGLVPVTLVEVGKLCRTAWRRSTET